MGGSAGDVRSERLRLQVFFFLKIVMCVHKWNQESRQFDMSRERGEHKKREQGLKENKTRFKPSKYLDSI